MNLYFTDFKQYFNWYHCILTSYMHILDSTYYYKHISLYISSVKMAYGGWYMQDKHHKIKNIYGYMYI
jgi:hypothetical protein